MSTGRHTCNPEKYSGGGQNVHVCDFLLKASETILFFARETEIMYPFNTYLK